MTRRSSATYENQALRLVLTHHKPSAMIRDLLFTIIRISPYMVKIFLLSLNTDKKYHRPFALNENWALGFQLESTHLSFEVVPLEALTCVS